MVFLDSSNPSALTRIINLTIYSQSALAATEVAFIEHCRVSTDFLGSERLSVSIMPVVRIPPQEIRTMLLEFWNFFLEQSCLEKLNPS